jgi:broad specificity phosphatase PhoE
MELVCARHGRTAWNADRRFQGQTDIPLDDEGRAQALALATHLRGESFDLAVASDLTRARTTAEAILAGRELTLALDPALREMHFGVWEGLTWTEIVARWPELAERYEFSPRYYVPEGGESWEHLCERVEGALRRVEAQLAPGGRALLVSHAGVMHAILHVVRADAATGTDVALRVRLAPASIVRVHGSFAGGWTVDAINETATPAETPV